MAWLLAYACILHGRLHLVPESRDNLQTFAVLNALDHDCGQQGVKIVRLEGLRHQMTVFHTDTAFGGEPMFNMTSSFWGSLR
jgi:hypothetical protein